MVRVLAIAACLLCRVVSGAATSGFASVVNSDYGQGHLVPAAVADGRPTFPLRPGPGEATAIRLLP